MIVRTQPAQLGVLPILAALPWVATAIGTALVGTGLYLRGREAEAYEDFNTQTQPPKPPPAPPAPQTATQMRTWTPDDLARASAASYETWRRDPEIIPHTPDTDPNRPLDTFTIAAAVAGSVALLLLLRGGR